MPALKGLEGVTYKLKAGWQVIEPSPLPSEGWKLHVAGIEARAQEILNMVLPVIHAEPQVPQYKFVAQTEYMAKQRNSATQRGKWFCIYALSCAQAIGLARAIEDRMAERLVNAVGLEAVGHDKQVDRGFVFTRYGSYTSPNIRNDKGEMVPDGRSATTHKPAWIQDIWLHYTALTQPRSRLAVSLPSGFFDTFPSYG